MCSLITFIIFCAFGAPLALLLGAIFGSVGLFVIGFATFAGIVSAIIDAFRTKGDKK